MNKPLGLGLSIDFSKPMLLLLDPENVNKYLNSMLHKVALYMFLNEPM